MALRAPLTPERGSVGCSRHKAGALDCSEPNGFTTTHHKSPQITAWPVQTAPGCSPGVLIVRQVVPCLTGAAALVVCVHAHVGAHSSQLLIGQGGKPLPKGAAEPQLAVTCTQSHSELSCRRVPGRTCGLLANRAGLAVAGAVCPRPERDGALVGALRAVHRREACRQYAQHQDTLP